MTSRGASARIPGAPGRDLVARHVGGLLAPFHAAGVLDVADVQVATALSRICGTSGEPMSLATALTVRALRNGSVCIDLRTVHATVFDESEAEIDTSALPWPEPDAWVAACEASPLVTLGESAASSRPLRLVNGQLYLERYWQQEELVRRELQARYAADPLEVDRARVREALDRLFDRAGLSPGEPDRQRLAAAVSALGLVTVLAGGPGTGKTTTVARILALLRDQPGHVARIALAAPTGKAAARLEEAVRTAASSLAAQDRERLGDVRASTLHRLLGWTPASRSRFRHDATNHLPHDIVVVDEVSMVSLTMMARLLDAVRPGARLILLGDPDQLSSVDAGAVLADIVGAGGQPSAATSQGLIELVATAGNEPAPAHGVVTLTRTWRYGAGIDELARAIRGADADRVVDVLRSQAAGIRFSEVDLAALNGDPPLADLITDVRDAGRQTVRAARRGDVDAALKGLERHRLLCAHRTGPFGVQRWGLEVERWLGEAIAGYGEDGEWYVGRPLLVTANDYEMDLFNGDTGVIVHTAAGPRAVFARGSRYLDFAPARLDAIRTVHAMTVHGAQGSQFERVAFVVPPLDSPLLTRELLYTAVTRASRQVHVVGTADAVRRAVLRPASRASGLRARLGR